MAAPTAPTLTSITTEALKKAGYADPATNNSSLLTRAQDEWMEEVKNDIWSIAKKLKSLHTTINLVTTQNQARYSLPTDYSSDMTLTAIHGGTRGTAQGGTSTTITLASNETVGDTGILGKYILIYSGTGSNAIPTASSMSRCIAYNSTTKVATVDRTWDTTPDSSSKYMIIDSYYPLNQVPIWEIDNQYSPDTRGTPSVYSPIGDSDDGEFVLYPVPYHSSGVPYGLILRYYADLLELDLSGTLISTLYKRWRNVFTYGVYWKALQNISDDRVNTAEKKYKDELAALVMREQYGLDMHNLQATIGE